MTNIFRNAARKIITSPAVIVVTLVFFALFIISLGLSIEDYMTSLKGYQLLPTAKANDWVVPLVAALPQVGQVAFMFAFATNTQRRWSLLAVFGLHVIDVLTDVYFKANGQGLWVWGIAFIESEVLYTLGSEIGLAFSVGMLLELAPHAVEQFGRLLHSITRAAGFYDAGDEPRPKRDDSFKMDDPFKFE